MTDLAPKQKICSICGKDVAHQRRTKDEQGNYICAPCFVARHAAKAMPEQLANTIQVSMPVVSSAGKQNAAVGDHSYAFKPTPEHPPAPQRMPPPLPGTKPPPISVLQPQSISYATSEAMARTVGDLDLNATDRRMAGRMAMMVTVVNFVMAVAIPLIWIAGLIFYVNMTPRPEVYIIAFAIFLVEGFWGGVYWLIGWQIKEGSTVAVVLGLILAAIASLLNAGAALFAAWSYFFNYGESTALVAAMGTAFMGFLYGMLSYHALRVLLYRDTRDETLVEKRQTPNVIPSQATPEDDVSKSVSTRIILARVYLIVLVVAALFINAIYAVHANGWLKQSSTLLPPEPVPSWGAPLANQPPPSFRPGDFNPRGYPYGLRTMTPAAPEFELDIPRLAPIGLQIDALISAIMAGWLLGLAIVWREGEGGKHRSQKFVIFVVCKAATVAMSAIAILYFIAVWPHDPVHHIPALHKELYAAAIISVLFISAYFTIIIPWRLAKAVAPQIPHEHVPSRDAPDFRLRQVSSDVNSLPKRRA